MNCWKRILRLRNDILIDELFMNKKRFFSLAIIYVLFIVVFMAATDIVLSLPLEIVNRTHKIETNAPDVLSSELVFNVDSFVENQDVLFSVEIIGWAFIPSESESDNKQIKLVFVSEDGRYEVETELQERFDQRGVFQQNNVSGYKHGFVTRFSPLQMKNGIYKLYLYCYENEGTSGIVDTGKMFIKTYRKFSEYIDTPVLETK